jgi:putative methionine-R-sulfoxide reductase with GAF domain
LAIPVKIGETLIDRPRLKIGREGITGWVAHSGEPLLVNDVSREPRHYFVEESKDTRSELAVPIKLKGEIVGVLADDFVPKATMDTDLLPAIWRVMQADQPREKMGNNT